MTLGQASAPRRRSSGSRRQDGQAVHLPNRGGVLGQNHCNLIALLIGREDEFGSTTGVESGGTGWDVRKSTYPFLLASKPFRKNDFLAKLRNELFDTDCFEVAEDKLCF